MTTIAWIGLGNMGKPMTKNLVDAGFTVVGFDLNEAALAAAVENGVTAARSTAEAVGDADFVFTMLPKGEHALAVYRGEGGVFANARSGAVLVDSSTIDVDTANELHEEAAQAGFEFLDAPVSGGISGAAAGTLTFMVGGEAETLEKARPVIDPMAGNIFHAGGNGAGQASKAVNNMMLAVSLQGVVEGAVLSRKLGLDPKTFHSIAKVSSGDSWPLRTWYPTPGVVETAAANNGFASTFAAALAHKDVGLALAAADSVGVDLPGAKLAYAQLQKLLDEGYGDMDCTLMIRNVDPEAPGVPQ
ncbi:3-hydroxyisobutyrate dehydrogenase [Brevibacterium samyangense]|uniref:3-hydroxyisobutyrate dehydrogenase n=2 Tax=Brevibacterium samyangense TaxID=366888 RepID=A0ABN2TAV8_9MICO